VFPLNLYARVRLLPPIARETAGAARTRSSLLPLLLRGTRTMQTSGFSSREKAKSYPRSRQAACARL